MLSAQRAVMFIATPKTPDQDQPSGKDELLHAPDLPLLGCSIKGLWLADVLE